MSTDEGTMPATAILSIPGFTDPVSSLTHLIAAGVFFVLGVYRLTRTGAGALTVIALGVYVFAVVFALSMSGVFHLLDQASTARMVLRRLDHAGIFFLIAATYTPVHVIQFRGFMRFGVLGIVWAIAIAAIVFKSIFFDSIPEWVSLLMYLGLGWAGLVSAAALWRRFGWRPLRPVVWGAAAYTAGALLEFSGYPVVVPGVLGPHELFHLFVLAGVSLHWVYVWRIASTGGN
jgi:channel protein (hemolysin III family)